jgi:CRISPR-associated endonuclease/helicase Cas3
MKPEEPMCVRRDAERLREALGLPAVQSPFPWQRSLLERFLVGDVPQALDVPTGLGKTAVMAIWLVARAARAPVPRRLVYIVDRRAVVDQATTVAESLRGFVERDPVLRSALGLRKPLPISTLRGQFVDNKEWLEDPSSPAIIVGTIDMVGSRLLFGGYGVTRKMRPFHAGLIGRDALVVLDESHLAPPFEALLRAVESSTTVQVGEDTVEHATPPFHLMSLSATGLDGCVATHTLGEEDLEHEVVAARLHAEKHINLARRPEGRDPPPVVSRLVEHAWEITNQARKLRRVVVYADRRDVAQKVVQGLERRAKDEKVSIQTELFVGGRRVFERTLAQARLRELGFLPDSAPQPATSPTFLVATSAGEVGVDLDADDMVCDLVAWERMVQRLGRVNRRGRGRACIVVVDEGIERRAKEEEAIGRLGRPERLSAQERKKLENVKKRVDARERAWAARNLLLGQLPGTPEGTLDGSPGALRTLRIRSRSDETLRRALVDATTPEPLRPALTRPLVDAWSMTSLDTHSGRPALAPWLRGWLPGEPPETTLVWRKHLPTREDGDEFSPGEVEAFFEAAPVHASETLDVETARVIEWLKARGNRLFRKKSAENAAFRPSKILGFLLDTDGRCHTELRLRDLTDPGSKVMEKLAGHAGTMPAACLILDAKLGGLTRGLLDEQEDTSPRTVDDDETWLFEGAIGYRVRHVGDPAEERDSMAPRWRLSHVHVMRETAEGEPAGSLVVEKFLANSAHEEDRATARPQLLVLVPRSLSPGKDCLDLCGPGEDQRAE